MRAFKRLSLDVPEGSTIYGDRAYNNYGLEDFLSEHAGIQLIAQRRKNSRRPLLAELKYLQGRMRKRIETRVVRKTPATGDFECLDFFRKAEGKLFRACRGLMGKR